MRIFYVLFKVESLPCSIYQLEDDYFTDKTRSYNYKKRIFIGKEVTWTQPSKSKYMGEDICYGIRKGLLMKGDGSIERGRQFFRKTILGVYRTQEELDAAYNQALPKDKEKISTYYNRAYVVTRTEEHKRKISETMKKTLQDKKNKLTS